MANFITVFILGELLFDTMNALCNFFKLYCLLLETALDDICKLHCSKIPELIATNFTIVYYLRIAQ